MEFIPQMEPCFNHAEADAVRDYMLSGGWVTEFRQTQKFEEMLCDLTGAKYCIATNNGTVSLTIGLLAAGIQSGDDVIVPDLTMIATPNAVKLIGAQPVFVDVETQTLNIDIEQMELSITDKTKAIIYVSLNGRSGDLERLKEICVSREIFLLEDSAQSLGSFYGDSHLGMIGDIGSFSFSTQKIISTGQGGALITNDDMLADKIRKIKDFGRVQGGNDIHESIGFNFKFTDIQATIGIEQMKKLSSRISRKKEIWNYYRDQLSGIREIEWIATNTEQTSPWFIDIFVENRDALSAHLKERGIGTRPIYPPIHAQEAYGLSALSFPVTERYSRMGLWLPSSSRLSESEIDRVCEGICSFY